MSDKRKIEELEKRIQELEKRIQELEKRPFVITISAPYPVIMPQPIAPVISPWPQQPWTPQRPTSEIIC